MDPNLASEKDKEEKLSKSLERSPDKNLKDARDAENSNVIKAHDAEITVESLNKRIEKNKSIHIEIISDALKMVPCKSMDINLSPPLLKVISQLLKRGNQERVKVKYHQRVVHIVVISKEKRNEN